MIGCWCSNGGDDKIFLGILERRLNIRSVLGLGIVSVFFRLSLQLILSWLILFILVFVLRFVSSSRLTDSKWLMFYLLTLFRLVTSTNQVLYSDRRWSHSDVSHVITASSIFLIFCFDNSGVTFISWVITSFHKSFKRFSRYFLLKLC